jgi:hypothetical protein
VQLLACCCLHHCLLAALLLLACCCLHRCSLVALLLLLHHLLPGELLLLSHGYCC